VAPGILLTVVGGQLGAGNTTLLKGVLRDAGDLRPTSTVEAVHAVATGVLIGARRLAWRGARGPAATLARLSSPPEPAPTAGGG
jgi:hypothetical protein